MVDVAAFCAPEDPQPQNRMNDGSELFPYLWRHFLRHQQLRDWLMRAGPHVAANVSPRQVAQGIAFCCNFEVPQSWQEFVNAFDVGEMFIPDHSYSHFMCGTVVAATDLHKHLICASDSPFIPHSTSASSYATAVRRMVVDMGSSRSINIMEFSWMQNGSLLVTTKVLVPPDPSIPYQSAGCTGAFAHYTDVYPGGPIPSVPRSFVSFIEVPRCPFCSARGSLGCYCVGFLAHGSRERDEYSSAVWPPRIANDVHATAIDSYHNVRTRLHLIQHVAHVKITKHPINVQKDGTVSFKSPESVTTHWFVKAVLFRPSSGFEADTLKQAGDKFRLLTAGSLSVGNAWRKEQEESEKRRQQQLLQQQHFMLLQQQLRVPQDEQEQQKAIDEAFTRQSPLIEHDAVTSEEIITPARPREQFDTVSCASISKLDPRNISYIHFPNGTSIESSRVTGMRSAYDGNPSGTHTGLLYGNNQSEASPTLTHTTQGLESKATETASKVTVSVSSVTNTGLKVRETVSAGSLITKKIQCRICGKTFSQQGSLNRHLKNIHESQKIPCEFCSQHFGQMYDLKRHQRRKHSERFSPNVRGERIHIK